jgi:hypothetical protein
LTDLATLGLAVDSSQVKTATTDLKNFEVAAKSTATAVDQTQARITALSNNFSRIAAPVAAMTVGVNGSAAAVTKLAAAFIPIGGLSLLFQGITAAASAYFALSASNQPTVEQSLQEQTRLLGLLKNAYKDATDQAGKFYEESKAIMLLQSRQSLLDLQRKTSEASAGVIGGVSSKSTVFDVMGSATGFETGLNVTDKYEAFKPVIKEYNESFLSGAPAVERYRDALAAIAATRPDLEATANELIKGSQKAKDLANAARDAEAMVAHLEGHATKAQRERIGIKDAPVAGKDEFERATESARKQIAVMQADADAVGLSSGAHARLRTEAALLEGGLRAGLSPEAVRASAIFQKLGQDASVAASALAKARVDSSIKFDRDTMFLSDTDVRIAQQLRDLYGNDIPAALASTEAAAMRVNAAMHQFNDIGKDALKGFAQDFKTSLSNGTSAWESFEKAGVNALSRISDKLMNMAIDNLWSAAFGGKSGSGLVGSLFSGGVFHGGYGPGARSRAAIFILPISRTRHGFIPALGLVKCPRSFAMMKAC